MNVSANPFVRPDDELRQRTALWEGGQFITHRGMIKGDPPSQSRYREADELRRRPVSEPRRDVCVPPLAVSIACDTPNPIPPHTTITVTSVWNDFTIGPSPAYQWQVGGLNLPEGAKYMNTQTAVLTVTDFTAANNQNYDVIATGACGTDTQSIPLTT